MPFNQSGGSAGSSSPGFEIGYDQITAPVIVASTTEATGTTVITCAAHTFDGSPVIATFSAPFLQNGSAASNAVTVSLFESATQIGRFTIASFGVANQLVVPCVSLLRFTPTAASHTYTVTAFTANATGNPTVGAGASGTGAYIPAFIRFTKV